MPDIEHFDDKDDEEEQECPGSQICGLKISAFWSENEIIKTASQTPSLNDETNKLTDVSETSNRKEKHVFNKNVSDDVVKPVDTVSDVKYVSGSNPIGDNINAPLFPLRSRNVSLDKTDIPAALDNCIIKETIPDTSDTGSSCSCIDAKNALVQSQLDVQDCQGPATSGVTAPRTNINEFLQQIARCSPISDVMSHDSIDSGDDENELDSEQDIEEFIINPMTDRKTDKKEADTVKDADVASESNTSIYETQEVEKPSNETSAEENQAPKSRKYEHSSPDKNQELLSCGKSKLTSNETNSENLIVISLTEELARSNTTVNKEQSELLLNANTTVNKEQSELLLNAIPHSIGAEDMSYIINQKSDPHELSKHCNPVIEIINDMDESKEDKIDTSTELERQLSGCEKRIQEYNSENMLLRNKANARLRDKTVDVSTNDSEARMKIPKGTSQNVKTHIFKNKKCPSIKVSNGKIYKKKKITEVRDKNLSTDIRKGEKTVDCRKSFQAKKLFDSIKDPQNVKARYNTEMKGLSTGNTSEKRLVANSNENRLAAIISHDQNKVRSLENMKRKLKENRPSPERKRVKLDDQISSQKFVKDSQKPKLGISREVTVNEIRQSNESTTIKKRTLFVEHEDICKSEKVNSGDDVFKPEPYPGDTGENDTHKFEVIRGKYQSSDKLLQVSDKIRKRKLVHDKDDTAAKTKGMKKIGNCLAEEKTTENCNDNFDKEPIQDRIINNNDVSLLTKQENFNVSRSGSNINIHENEKFTPATKSKANTVTIEKSADQVLSDVISACQSSKNKVYKQNNGMEGHKLFKASVKANFSETRPSPKKLLVKKKIHSQQHEKKRTSKGIVSNIPKLDNFDNGNPPKNNKELLSELQDYIENIKKQVVLSFNKDVHEIRYHPNFSPYYRCYVCFDLFFTSQERLDLHNRVSHNMDKSNLVKSENKKELMTPGRVKKVLEKDSVDKDVWSESGNPESVRRVLSSLIMESNSDESKLVESEIEKSISNAKTETQQDPKLTEENENPYSICHSYEKQIGTSLVCRDNYANEGQIETNKCDIQEEMQTEEHCIKEDKNGTSQKNSSAHTNSGGIVTCAGQFKDDDDAEINQSYRGIKYEKVVVSDKTDSVKTGVVNRDTKQKGDCERETSKEKISVCRNTERLEINTTELKDFDDTIGNNQIDRQVHDEVVVSNETKPRIVNCHTECSMKDKENASKEREDECKNAGVFTTKNRSADLQDTRNNYPNKEHFRDNVLNSDKNVFSKPKVGESDTAQVEDDKEKTQKVDTCDSDGVRRSPSVLKHVSDYKYISKNRDSDHDTPSFSDETVSEKCRTGSVNIKPFIREKSHRLHEQRPSKFKSSECIVTNANKTTETNDEIRHPCFNKMHVQVRTTASQEDIETEMKTTRTGTPNIQLKTQKSSRTQQRKIGNSKSVVSNIKTLKQTKTGSKCRETDNVKEVKEMTADHFANDVPEVGEPVENKKYDGIKEIGNTKCIKKSGYVCDVEKINAVKERKVHSTEHLVASHKQKEKSLSCDSKDSSGRTNKVEKPKQVAKDSHTAKNEMGHEILFENNAHDNLDEMEKCKIEATGSLQAKMLLKLSEDSDSNSMRARVDSMSSLDSLTSYLEFEADINWGDLSQEKMHTEKDVFHKSRDSYRQNEKIAEIHKSDSIPTSYSKERIRRFSGEEKYEKCKHCKGRDECSHCLSDNRKRRHNSGSSKASDTQSEKYRSRHRSGSSGSQKSLPENNDRKNDMHSYRRSPKLSRNVSQSRRHDSHKRRRSRSRDRYYGSIKKARERELKTHFIEIADRHQNYSKSHCRCYSCRKSSSSRHLYKCLENDREIRGEIVSKCKKIPQRNVSEIESPRKSSRSFRERIQLVKSSKFKPSTKRRPTLSHTEKGKYLVKVELDDKSPQDSTARLGVDKSVTEISKNRPGSMESSSKEKINESASEVNDSLGKVDNSVENSLGVKQKASTHESTLCNTCYIKFNSIHDLSRHLYKEHEDVSKCVECRLAFFTVVDYDDHIAEKHANVNPCESTIDDSIKRKKEEIKNESSTPSDNRHVNNDETRRRNKSGRNDKPIDYQRFCRICKVEFYTRDELVDHLWDKHRKRVQRFLNEPDSGPHKFTPNAAEYRRSVERYDHSLTCRICSLRLRSKDELFHHLHVKHNIGPKVKVFETHFSPKGLQRL